MQISNSSSLGRYKACVRGILLSRWRNAVTVLESERRITVIARDLVACRQTLHQRLAMYVYVQTTIDETIAVRRCSAIIGTSGRAEMTLKMERHPHSALWTFVLEASPSNNNFTWKVNAHPQGNECYQGGGNIATAVTICRFHAVVQQHIVDWNAWAAKRIMQINWNQIKEFQLAH